MVVSTIVRVVSRYTACGWKCQCLLFCTSMFLIGYIGTADDAVCSNLLWMRPEPLLTMVVLMLFLHTWKNLGLKCDRFVDNYVCGCWCSPGRVLYAGSDDVRIKVDMFRSTTQPFVLHLLWKSPHSGWKTAQVQHGSRYIFFSGALHTVTA